MGRTAAGVIGMELDEGDQVVALLPISDPGHALFVLSENGYGKATPLQEFRITHRGGKGIRAFQVTEKTGPVVAALELRGDEELMLVTREGQSLRFSAKEIPILGRATQGSRLMRLKESDQIASVSRRIPDEE
jgi:DNA gyrase subunit A